VGGEFFNTVIQKMNTFGRVSICGAISQYNMAVEDRPKGKQKSMVYMTLFISIYFQVKLSLLNLISLRLS